MERKDSHISDARIRQFAYGDLVLQPEELVHFQNCDQCSETWWRLKQEAKRKKPGDTTEKSA